MCEKINISHLDLDGIMSNVVLKEKFGDMDTFHISYNEIQETLELLETEINHLTQALFVTDLAFDAKSFNVLMRIAETNPDLRIVYIDHHPYEGEESGWFAELKTFENVRVIHEIRTSATQLTFDYCKIENQNLKNLVRWTNAFDIWKETEEPGNFQIGWFLNTIFWELKANSFKINIVRSEYKIPPLFMKMYKETIKKKDEYFQKLIKNGLVIFDEEDKILLSFSDHHKSFWQQDYPDFDFYVLPYETRGNNLSVRISQRIPDEDANLIKKDVIGYVKKSPWHISSGGHDRAFGITLDKNMPKDDHLLLIEGIIDMIKISSKGIFEEIFI